MLRSRQLATINIPVDSSLVLARTDIHGLFLLNPTARLIWEQLACGSSPDEIARTFESTFGLSPEVARHDVEATLAQWSGSLLSPEPACIDCRLGSSSFRIVLDIGDLSDEIAPRLEHLEASIGVPDFTFRLTAADDSFRVLRDGVLLAVEKLPSAARAILLQEMTRLCQPGRDWSAVLHAGAVGDSRACVLLAGATHSGKSTLSAALMQAGLICYSDDSAVIDRVFFVCGMPFPVMLREDSWQHFPALSSSPVYQRWGVNIRFLATNLPSDSSPAVPARAIVFVAFEPNSTTELTEISTFEALLALQNSGFWVEHTPLGIERFLDWLKALPKYTLRYSSLPEAVSTVQALL